MKKLYIIGSGPGDISLILLKSFYILYISDSIFYDSLINLDLLNFCNKLSKKILIGKKSGQFSIYKKTIYKIIYIFYIKYSLLSKIKSGDTNFFSRIYNEKSFFKIKNIDYDIIPGITSSLSIFTTLKLSLTFRFNVSTILFITYFNNINILKLNKSFIDETIIFYMVNNNFYYILNSLKVENCANFYINISESISFIYEHFFIFNIYDVFLGLIKNFLFLKFPKILIISNLIKYIDLFDINVYLFN